MGKTSRVRRMISPAEMRTVRHRLAYHTNAEIAAAYGVSPETVRCQLHSALTIMRQRTTARLHGTSDLLLLAQSHGVKPLAIAACATNVERDEALDALDMEPVVVC